jgi:shikimate dehydrogenase
MNLYGLIGYRLGHSFSKKYFTQKFEKEGLAGCFFELDNIDLFPGLLQSNPALKGLAVTIPYKQTVMPYLQQISGEAQKIGAVNCIEFLPGGLKGHNTDIIGFERSFAPLLQAHHTKALILGTGGSSRAVQYVLQKLGIEFLLVSRNPEGRGQINYQEVDAQLLTAYTVIINCSPVGMSPDEGSKPDIVYKAITSQHYLFDLVYQPAETLFLREGKERGAVVKNGYDMLVLQAEENSRIWNEGTIE